MNSGCDDDVPNLTQSAGCAGIDKITGTTILWDESYDLTKATYIATDVVTFMIIAIDATCEKLHSIEVTVKVPEDIANGTFPFNFPWEAEDGEAFGNYTTIDLPDGKPFVKDFSPAGEIVLTKGLDEKTYTIELDVKTTAGLSVEMEMTRTF